LVTPASQAPRGPDARDQDLPAARRGRQGRAVETLALQRGQRPVLDTDEAPVRAGGRAATDQGQAGRDREQDPHTVTVSRAERHVARSGFAYPLGLDDAPVGDDPPPLLATVIVPCIVVGW